jgi:hypothetical protein
MSKASNLFFRETEKVSLKPASFSRWMLNLACGLSAMSLKDRSLILMAPITSWWSEATLAPLLDLVSCRLRLHFREIVM